MPLEPDNFGIMKNSRKHFNEILNILGKPYCEGDKFAVYNCDCLEAMKKLPEKLINLTVTNTINLNPSPKYFKTVTEESFDSNFLSIFI